MKERLQKIMAQIGIGSRRECEAIIANGRVAINGKVAGVGDKADLLTDRIEIDGRLEKNREKFLYIKVYKPLYVLSTTKNQDERKIVRDIVPINSFLFLVGRLDFNSEGLILLTNDGSLANHLTHPRYKCEKEYQVQVRGAPSDVQLAIWRKGLILRDGFRTSPSKVKIIRKDGNTTWLSVILKEGHKHQLREMGHSTNLPVLRIVRVRIGSLKLGKLKAGQWENLSDREIRDLQELTNK